MFTEKQFDFTSYWAFFAIGQHQFDQALAWRDPDDIASCWNCLYAPKEVAEQMMKDFDAHIESERLRRLHEVGLKNIILYELNNYECYYTGDIEDALPILESYWATPDQVWALFKDKNADIDKAKPIPHKSTFILSDPTMPKTILIKAEYTFEVTWEIKAENYQQALEHAKKHCWCIEPKYHSSLPHNDIDWNWSVHPVRSNYARSNKASLYS